MGRNFNLVGEMSRFAKEQILICPGLGQDRVFPEDLWAEMGDKGLLNPLNLNRDTPCRSIAAAARTMVEQGGNLGLPLSWMIHQMTARYLIYPNLSCIVDQGFWERVKSGRTTVSFAVSEPNAGAHPKFMSASAEKHHDGWELTGDKVYLTNGPIAECFVFIAVTGQEAGECGGEKRFSAFLVPRGIPGLSQCTPMDIPFFKPSPHGNIRLENCRLGPDRMLGTEGRAFDDLVLPFRRLEDAAMTGAVSGAVSFLVSRTAGALAGTGKTDPELLESLGELGAAASGAAYLSDRIALMADLGPDNVTPDNDHTDVPLENLVLCFRQATARFMEGLNRFLTAAGISLEGRASVLARDLASSAKIGGTVAGIKKKKLARTLLEPYQSV